MDYYKILDFGQEPFSNSPDPAFFFQSRQHLSCLQKLEVALRLKRGLNIVIGNVGTGKTTLCRQLIQRFVRDDAVETHLIFDPAYSTPVDFLTSVAGLFGQLREEDHPNEWQLKETIKKYLFARGVEEGKTVVLIVDEGQKIPGFCLEILREFLNYETNEYKLLQIVIFAQTEFEATIKEIPNFEDRVNLLHFLEPLDFKDTRNMIEYRLKRASKRERTAIRFTYPALRSIYRATRGYPRKIIHLCHKIVLSLIIQNRSKVTASLVRSCVRREGPEKRSKKLRWSFVTAGACALFTWAIINMVPPPYGIKLPWVEGEKVATEVVVKEIVDSPAPEPASKPEPVKVADEQKAVQANSSGAKTVEAAVTPLPDPFTEKSAPLETKGPVEPKDVSKAPPEIIGKIRARRLDVVSRMISRIYGSYHSNYLDEVSKVNPHIKDLDNIAVGEVISFPSIIPEEKAFSEKGVWLSLAEEGSVEKAYDALMAYPGHAPAVRIISYWNGSMGLRSAVVIKRPFIDEAAALKFIDKLDPSYAAKAKVIAGWEDGTLFFCERND